MPNTALQRRQSRFGRYFPPSAWWPMVTPATLKADLLSGLTGAVVVLPQGVAFATIAGMPPVYGLYAGMVPAIVAALFGSSWHLVSGPTTAASIVLFSLLSVHAEPGSAQYIQLALTMTFLVGLVQLGLGLVRMGLLVNFISHSVVIGFTSGAALLIASNQLKNFFGIHLPQGGDFIHTMIAFFNTVGSTNPYVLMVGLATLLGGIIVRSVFPRIPYMIVALFLGSLMAWLINLSGDGTQVITTVGALSASLPPLSFPDFSLSTLRTLAPGVIAVSLLALTEALSIARALALRSGQSIDSNQEFIAQGLSNLVGSFFSAYVATGSFNRSGLNYESGARTPLAAAFSGFLLMGLVTLVAPITSYLPHAAMAGVLFLVAWGLIDFHHIGKTIRTSRSEAIIMTATFLSTLVLDLEVAIILGVMLSLGIYLARTSHPKISIRIPDPNHPRRHFTTPKNLPECPQVRIVRIDGSLFFAAVSQVEKDLDEVMATVEGRHLVVIASGINFIDLSGAEFLANKAKKLKSEGGGLYLVLLKATPYALLQRGGYLEDIGPENCFVSRSEAIHQIFAKLDGKICAHCPHFVFNECSTIPKVDHDQQMAGHAAIPVKVA